MKEYKHDAEMLHCAKIIFKQGQVFSNIHITYLRLWVLIMFFIFLKVSTKGI